ncbi:MAG: hypothetical protein M3N13_07720 [Candidatus Eremiobacteraeota bacterium]|nr:hypothetical protein [Candidatus Eremiobacteraeota bacterium]
MLRTLAFLCAAMVSTALPVCAAPLDGAAFTDSQSTPDIRFGSTTKLSGILVREISFVSGMHRADGILVQGSGNRRHPGALFVHWLGDPKTTNRTEFEPDAIALAKKGVTSLLMDAMWSKEHWFEKGRSTSSDYAASIAQVVT